MLTHWEVLRDLWLYVLEDSPYMETYEKQNMKLGAGSAVYRFFTLHVMGPAVSTIVAMDNFYEDPSNAQLVRPRTSGQQHLCLFSVYPHRKLCSYASCLSQVAAQVILM